MRLVHYSANPDLSLSVLYNVRQKAVNEQGYKLYKPLGLWLSDDDDYGWKEWCEAEGYRLDKLKFAYLVELNFKNILHIKSATELRNFHKKYLESNFAYDFLGWQKVAQDYKGIIISPYQWDMRLDNEVEWYYGWDVACACIWDMGALKSFEKIKEV